MKFGVEAMNTPVSGALECLRSRLRRWRYLDAAPALAAEKVYDPPVGSRWTVETETRSEEMRPDGTATSLIRARAELTIEQKTADGFRISYVQRDATVEGNARSVPLRRAYLKVLENVVIRASTDASGKPLHIDNLDEAKASCAASQMSWPGNSIIARRRVRCSIN